MVYKVYREGLYNGEWLLKELKKWLKEARENTDIVFIKQLCEGKRYCYTDIDQSRQYNIRIKSAVSGDISSTWSKIKHILESRVADGCLKGKYNSNIGQLFLKHNHNWQDKQIVENKHLIEQVPDKELQEDLANEMIELDGKE